MSNVVFYYEGSDLPAIISEPYSYFSAGSSNSVPSMDPMAILWVLLDKFWNIDLLTKVLFDEI